MLVEKMARIASVAWLWILLITQTSWPVCGDDVLFLDMHVGESVVFPCVSEENGTAPMGVYLKRTWLRPGEVLFMLTNDKPSAHESGDDHRIAVAGDPARRWLNVTLSQLRTTDTDRYYCQFVSEGHPEYIHRPGKTEFFLHVSGDGPSLVDMVRVEACAGESVVLPCVAPHGKGLAVEGVTLKRQKGPQAPVEVLYHSKRHLLPPDRVLLSPEPGPRGIAYNLTLMRLQPDDSAFYSCQLLVHDRPDSGTGLGRRVFSLSVQGGQCSCSSYTTLLYALSSAVAVLLITLLVGLMVYYRGRRMGNGHRSVKPQPQAPIYEEMVGMQLPSRKAPLRHLEETDTSHYSNCSLVAPRQENAYEGSNGGFSVREEDHK